MVVPDREVVTAAGQRLAVVSQDALVKALVSAAVVLDQIGGCVFIQVNRESTGVDGEKATTLAQVIWKDRTDARAQPEQTGTLTAPAAAPELALAPEPVSADGDGDYAPEPGEVAVDEAAVPAGLREGA